MFNSSDILFYNGGKDYYFVIKDNNKYYYILNGVKSDSFDYISFHYGNNKGFYLIGKKQNKYILIHNGKKIYESRKLLTGLSLYDGGVRFLEKDENKLKKDNNVNFIIKEINISYKNNKSFGDIFESKNIIIKDLAVSRHRLNKTLKGKKYIKYIDKIVQKYSKNKRILEKLYKKLDNLDVENGKYKKIKDIIIYLKAKVGLEIYKNQTKSN